MEQSEAQRWFVIAPGIVRRTLAAGEHMMQILVTLEQGCHLPEHSHHHEQLTYLLQGRLRMYIGGQVVDLAPGDAVCIPSGVVHAADVLEQGVAIDTFSPPREDMLAQDRT